MEARIDFVHSRDAAAYIRPMMAVGGVLRKSPLPALTQELVSLRVSQINGCGPCIDMHTKEAVEAGATPEQLALVAAWREATVFSAADRAALELAEQGTRVADAGEGVSDPVWTRATEHFDEAQLIALVTLVAFMNTANRINIITRQQTAGDYKAGSLH
ncbi:carboxymuconolactone decarboxylase family protein [Nocardiopsis coralliicola]